jgi:hypothetical protein
MEFTPDYAHGHLVVAAVRILEHRNEKPPTMEEIGELIGISHEVVGAVARALQSRGIVKILETPFDTRIEVAEHLGLEELPRDHSGAAMKSEVDAFLERSRTKQEEIESLFKEGAYEQEKKEKFAGLDQKLKEFQKAKARDPFAATDDGGAEEESAQEGAEVETGEEGSAEEGAAGKESDE